MDPVKKGGPEQLCQWGAADYALMAKAQKSMVDTEVQVSHRNFTTCK
jgi:hypothetical protein